MLLPLILDWRVLNATKRRARALPAESPACGLWAARRPAPDSPRRSCVCVSHIISGGCYLGDERRRLSALNPMTDEEMETTHHTPNPKPEQPLEGH
jgi:hypothetical protein